MRKSLITLLAILLIGCATLTPAKNFATINSSVAALKADLQSALRLISTVRATSTPANVALLDQATASLTDANKNADFINPANEKWNADYKTKSDDDTMVRASWGWRLEQFLKAFFWISLASAIAIIAGGSVLFYFFGAETTWLGMLARFLHALLPLQNAGNIANWFKGKTVVALKAGSSIIDAADTAAVSSVLNPTIPPTIPAK